jgi:hypothetical protein
MRSVGVLLVVLGAVGCQTAAPVGPVAPPPSLIPEGVDPGGVLRVQAILDLKAQKLSDGSCTVVGKRGDEWLAVTCAHCVPDRLHNGAKANITYVVDDTPARVVRRDDKLDLALLAFRSPRNYPCYSVGPTPDVGDPAVAVGWGAVGIRGEGIIHRRHAQYGHVSLRGERWIGINCGVKHGFSGGAILDGKGRLIGILRMAVFGGHAFGYARRTEVLKGFLQGR